MTALLKDRKTDKMGPEDQVFPALLEFPVAASTKIFGGALVCTDALGNAKGAVTATGLIVLGRCEKQVDNTAGAAGDLKVFIRQGVFMYDMGTAGDAITNALRGKVCYASDDHTVNATDGTGTRSAAGIVVDVQGSQVAVLVGFPTLTP